MRHRGILGLAAALLLVNCILIYSVPGTAEPNQAPSIKNTRCFTEDSSENTPYTFYISYQDTDNDPPSKVVLLLGSKEYSMSETDPTDENYSDGKEYAIKKSISAGKYSYSFLVSDGNHTTQTTRYSLEVMTSFEEFFDTPHGDLHKVLFMLTPIFVFLMVAIILLFHRINKNLSKLIDAQVKKVSGEDIRSSDNKKAIGKASGEDIRSSENHGTNRKDEDIDEGEAGSTQGE